MGGGRFHKYRLPPRRTVALKIRERSLAAMRETAASGLEAAPIAPSASGGRVAAASSFRPSVRLTRYESQLHNGLSRWPGCGEIIASAVQDCDNFANSQA